MRIPPSLAAICLLLPIAGCGQKPAETLRAEAPWVRLAAVPGRPAAGYFTLRGGPAADRLIAVESPAAARAELHSGGMVANMATMKPMAGMDLPAGGRANFAPGGDHVMLFGVDPAIRAGGTMPLRLRFQSGTAVDATARVIAAGDPAPSLEHD